MTNKIEIRDVTKTFKEGDILKNVSFTAEEGEVTAFLGPNGAGKSSTLRILLGLDRPSSGTALIGGKKYCDIERPLLTVGASFDGVGAPSDRTVFQHLKIAAASNGIDYSRISEVLSITDIEHKRNSKIGNLSLGEGQRLGIATALLGNPQYLILDEPTNGLDPSGIRWFRNFIREQANTGKTVLLSSHILSEVEAVTDRVVFIDKGSIIALGTLHNILNGFDNLEDVFFHLTMMSSIKINNTLSELYKIFYSRSTQIVLPIVFIFQPLLSYISSKQILAVGLNATPETNSSLVEPIPPIEYIGFEAILLGLFAMITLGAILGSMEYKNSSLRTSLLLCSNKAVFFVIKFFVTSVFIFVVSFVSIYLSIASAQFGLEREGLSPLVLSNNVWYFILLGSLSWSLLTVLSYSIAFYFKSSLGSLLFLLPQVYNLGSFLADRIQLAKYLPVSLGQDLIATSPLKITTPGRSVLFLSTWVLVISSFAYYKFLKEDVGNVR